MELETSVLNRMIAYFGGDVRRVSHALKVYAFARALSGGLNSEKRTVLLLAAILHDIGIKNAEQKYRSSAGSYQELEGPPVARGILEELGVPPAAAERVCFLIGHHHTYSAIDGDDFQILVEADFLVNIAEDGLSKQAAESARNKYFKTPQGIAAVNSLYGL